MAGTEFFVVPVEHLSTIEEMKYPEGVTVRRLYTSHEGRVLFRLDCESTATIPYMQQDRIDIGIAFNSLTLLGGHLIWHLQARFDHMGHKDNSMYAQVNNDLYDLWDRYLPVCVPHREQRSACVKAFAARDDWDNQVAWGKLHRVKRLIGAV